MILMGCNNYTYRKMFWYTNLEINTVCMQLLWFLLVGLGNLSKKVPLSSSYFQFLEFYYNNYLLNKKTEMINEFMIYL